MKKTFAIILIAMMAMTAVFAANANVDPMTVINNQSSTLDISLTLDPDKLYFYSFGFTDATEAGALGTDSREVPEASGTLVLKVNESENVAKNSDQKVSFYYKAKSDKPFTLTFEMADLNNSGTNIGLNATFTKIYDGSNAPTEAKGLKLSSKNGSIGQKSITLAMEGASGNLRSALYGIDFVTEQLPMVASELEFTSTITATISAD